jgi:ATP-binding cassette subfamily F protein uup
VITVSHDRYFLDRVAQRILAFANDGSGTIREYPGNYSVYEEYRAQEEQEERAATAARASAAPAAKAAPGKEKAATDTQPRRLSYKERRELQTLERRIAEMESRKETLNEQINQSGSDYQRYEELAAELTALDADLDAAVERWAELAALE